VLTSIKPSAKIFLLRSAAAAGSQKDLFVAFERGKNFG